mmetsp:Transcript_5739/g.6817  ORF Transcript_5739/g.6817 Transcript_5739/m.6817 type:complete len:142 (+) Transcript_5739:367-792(+)|eukprot:CAMPEP_0204836560 /NCGR_PEP_ID=MMETSP1346-20131115/25483_1 /ASSEMBLY_ACC=CAM_ASM_000771 /TAXON_ID=215587 /ORGANISM="Aplanochytrium stocchinoi, Strain GSBS06" /LENGTH=141 /DNA_ID=CAMNT_0051971375 /DNA_START=344 /DNA_END=769 /DNA_ORIENTATION=+
MVYITASGDIVKEQPANQGNNGSSSPQRRRMGGIGTLGSSSAQQPLRQGQQQAGGSFANAGQLQMQGQDGMLSGVSRMLGIEGKRVTLPAVPWAGFAQPMSVPTINCLVIVLIFMIFGFKGGLASVFLYGLSLRQEQTRNR